jgi:hypothetical protein
MMRYIRAYAGLTLLLLTALPAAAQVWEGGIDLAGAVPMGEFRKNVSHAGFGILLNVGYAPEADPFMIGLEFAFYQYGEKTMAKPISGPFQTVMADVSTANRFFSGHFFVRLQPNVGFVRPYLQGHAGGNLLWTETTVKNPFDYGSVLTSTDNLRDGAFSYGVGTGVRFLIYTPDEGEEIEEVFIDLGARYTYGGKARYYQEGAVDPGGLQSRHVESKTDIAVFYLGATVRF